MDSIASQRSAFEIKKYSVQLKKQLQKVNDRAEGIEEFVAPKSARSLDSSYLPGQWQLVEDSLIADTSAIADMAPISNLLPDKSAATLKSFRNLVVHLSKLLGLADETQQTLFEASTPNDIGVSTVKKFSVDLTLKVLNLRDDERTLLQDRPISIAEYDQSDF